MIRVLDNGLHIEEGVLRYAWFRLETLETPEGEKYRCVAFRELASVPYDVTRDADTLGRQWAALRGVYNAGVDYLYTALGIFHPQHVGIVQLYGAAGEGASRETAAALAHLRDPESRVSAHYVIDREGEVYQLVPERVVAYHVACGVEGCVSSCPAFLCGDGKPETRTIGIELVNLGKISQDWQGTIYEDYGAAFGWRWWEDYPEAQRQALKRLVEDIARRWGFPVDGEHVLGHYRVQGKRDPGPALNLFWERNGNLPREAVFP